MGVCGVFMLYLPVTICQEMNKSLGTYQCYQDFPILSAAF